MTLANGSRLGPYEIVSPLGSPDGNRVEADRKKVLARVPLSPVLLVRAPERCKVVIADGYHRLCAVYSFDEDAEIPCRIV
jgi:hypothetical protein